MAEPTVAPPLPDYASRTMPTSSFAPIHPEGSGVEDLLARGKRKASTTFGQYAGAMFDQDNSLTGIIAHRVGSQMLPQEGFNPMSMWGELTQGVAPQYHHELTQATSPAHGLYLKDLLMQKADQLQKLGDLDTLGNVGRFSYGLLHGIIDPINIPTLALATPARFFGKLAVASAGGVVQERVRQNVNFEQDNNQLLDAALTSALFAAPFAGISSASRRWQATALRDKRALEAARTEGDQAAAVNAQQKIIHQMIVDEQHAMNNEQWDLAEQIEQTRIAAEKEQMFRDLRGDDGAPGAPNKVEQMARMEWEQAKARELETLRVQQALETATEPSAPTAVAQAMARAEAAKAEVDAKAAAYEAARMASPAVPTAKSPMQLALEGAGIAKERTRATAVDLEGKARAERVEQAAAKTKAAEAEWASFFKQVDEDGDGVMLRATGTLEERTNAATRGTPRPLAEIDSDQRAIDALNSTVQGLARGGRASFDARPVLHVDAGLAALANGFAERFGRRIVYFRDAAGQGLADGAFVRRMGDTLFVREDTPKVAEIVAMHEFFHSLRQADPARYAQFAESVQGVIKAFPEYHAEFVRNYEAKGIKLPSADKINEEFLAEIVEKMANDKKLQAYMNRREGGIIKQLVADLLDWIEAFVARLVGGSGIPTDPHLAKYVSDINQFRRKLAKFVMNAADATSVEGATQMDPALRASDTAMFSAAHRAMVAPVVPTAAPLSTTMAKARWDYVAQIHKGANEMHKKIVSMLVRDVLGKDQGWTASEWATQTLRRNTIPAHFAMGQEFDKAAHTLGWGQVDKVRKNHLFFEAVSRVKRGDLTDIEPGGQFEKTANEVKAAAAAAGKAYDGILKAVQDSGWDGAAAIPVDPQYVNRVWRADAIKEAINKYGEGHVFQAVADSFVNPQHRGDLKKAEGFVRAIMRLEYSPAMRELTLGGGDMTRLRFELDQAGLSSSQSDLIVEVMLGVKKAASDVKDQGQPTNMRFRMGLDESHEHTVGPNDKLRITDLLENDIRVLLDGYSRSMSGHAGMGKVGITSRKAFSDLMAEATGEHATGGQLMASDSGEFNRNTQHLNDLYDNITGRPMSSQVFNRADRIMGGLRGLTRGAMLGQLGVAQGLEANNAAGMAGMAAVNHHMPTAAALIKQAREGRIMDDALQQDLEHLFGTGMEHAAAYVRDNEASDFAYASGPKDTLLDRVTNTVEKAGNRVSHAVNVVSGNKFMTSFTRSFATRWAIQQMVDHAHGKGTFNPERLRGLGIAEVDIKPYLADLKAYAKVDSKGTVVEIDWENWQQNNPATHDQFTLTTMRRVRDMIQDHDIGETMPWMHTTLGKLFGELRTFMLVGHAKQFLKNVHYRDREATRLFTVTLMAQALGYTAQASLNNAGNAEKLQKALEPERIAKATVQRMSITGMMPMLFETGYFVGSGGKSFFSGGSFNTDSRNFLMTPSLTMLTRAADTAKVVGGAVNPWSDAVRTEKEMKSAYGLLPFSNTYGIRNLITGLTDGLPKGEPQGR